MTAPLIRSLEQAGEGFKASSRRDITDLAWLVESVSPGHQARVAASINFHGLMVIDHWLFRWLFWLMKKRPNPINRMAYFYIQYPDEARHLLTETARHIRHGIDREEASSVGGFSQREVNLMVTILRANPKGQPNV